MKAEVVVRVSEHGGAYIANARGGFRASSTCSAEIAVLGCAAKALGLSPAKCPKGISPSAYFHTVEIAMDQVEAVEDTPGVWKARKVGAA